MAKLMHLLRKLPSVTHCSTAQLKVLKEINAIAPFINKIMVNRLMRDLGFPTALQQHAASHKDASVSVRTRMRA